MQYNLFVQASIFSLSLMVPEIAAAQSECNFERPSVGFGLNSESFVGTSDDILTPYVSGFLGGLISASALGANDTCYNSLLTCLSGKSPRQLAAIIQNYVRDSPEIWHIPMNISAYNAISEYCELN